MRMIMITACLAILLLVAFDNTAFALGEEMEKALIDGQWNTLFELIKADSASVDDPIARLLMGHTCLAIKNNYGASSNFSSVLEESDLAIWLQFTKSLADKYSDNKITQYLWADAKMRNGLIDDAIAGFNKAIEIDSLFALAYYQKGFIYTNLNYNFNSAVSYFNKAAKADPQFSRAYMEIGTLYSKINKYDIALDYANKSLAIDSQSAIAFFNRANAYYHLGKYKKAILDYDQAIMIRPFWPEAFYNRGNVFLFGTKAYLSAILDYDKALVMREKYADALRNRGMANSYQGKLPDALSDYTKLIRIDSTDAGAYSSRGNVLMNLGKMENALKDYNKAIEINPEHAEAYENRGFLYMVHLGDSKKACADWKKACELGKCNNYNLAVDGGDCK